MKEEQLKLDNKSIIIESNQINSLQEQNVILAKQLQEIKLELEEYKNKENTNLKNIDLQETDTLLVSLKMSKVYY